MQVQVVPVADAGAMLQAAADALLELARNNFPDLSRARVLLPNLHAGAEFKRRLLACAGTTSLLLPRISTYAALAEDGDADLHDTARAAWLYGALRARNWFDDTARWGVCRELGALFDELTARNLALPRDLGEFRAQLREAYGGGGERGIDFEASLVGELWFALEGAGAASPAAQRKLRLAQHAAVPDGPLIAVLCDPPSPEQDAFFAAWSARQAVAVIQFEPTRAVQGSPGGLLNLVWPPAAAGGAEQNAPEARPLYARAGLAREQFAASPLAGRVSLVGAAGSEQEASAALLSIRAWLHAGAQSIAVVTQDRLVARRLRALLERERVLVSDEAGWRLSTTSAATVIARWLDNVADGFYHRDLLDLLKSPFALSDIETGERRAQVHALEQLIRRENVIEGLDGIARATTHDPGRVPLAAIVHRLRGAAQAQSLRTSERRTGVPLGAWLTRLDQALDILGIAQGLDQDAAGRQLRELLRARAEAVADDRQDFAFHEWRSWLSGEFETATFRDTGIDSRLVFTDLVSMPLRRFDKVLVLGADAQHLPGVPAAARFFNQRVRASLGLPTLEDAAESLRRAFIGLFTLAGEVRVSWQAQVNGEPNAPAALVDVLQIMHRSAFGDDLQAPELAAWLRQKPAVPDATPHHAPRPSAPALAPQQVSTSGYASLMACPYQFFARHMLRLNESDEVEEQVAKRDFGEAVHRILKAFHEQVPLANQMQRQACLHLLEQLGDHEFAPLLRRDPLAAGYQAEWRAMAPKYLDWQCAREGDGWRFQSAEVKRELTLELPGGDSMVFSGRLDRVDVGAGGSHAVLDYKTRRMEALKMEVAAPDEHVQLASYALLQSGVDTQATEEAGFIALERQRVSAVRQPGDLQDITTRTAQRLVHVFSGIRAGAELPAQGVEMVCGFCEMRGLCRRDYWDRE